jgi:hypothetical protein
VAWKFGKKRPKSPMQFVRQLQLFVGHEEQSIDMLLQGIMTQVGTPQTRQRVLTQHT